MLPKTGNWQPQTGFDRALVLGYTVRAWHKMTQEDRCRLHELGFVLPHKAIQDDEPAALQHVEAEDSPDSPPVTPRLCALAKPRVPSGGGIRVLLTAFAPSVIA